MVGVINTFGIRQTIYLSNHVETKLHFTDASSGHRHCRASFLFTAAISNLVVIIRAATDIDSTCVVGESIEMCCCGGCVGCNLC